MKKTLLVLLSSLTVACAAAGAAFSLPTPFAGADTNAVTTETIETIEADFSDAAHASHFEKYGTSAGWAVTDGKYSPNDVWATVNTAKKLDLTKSQQISFDVFLTSADANKQFNIGFFETKTEETNTQPNTGLTFSFSNFISVYTSFGRNGWESDCVKDIFNDQTHSVTISMQEKALSVTVDGEQLAFLSYGAAYTPTLTADSAYLLLQATSTSTYIDNFKIGEITQTEPTPPPVETIDELSLPFDEATDGDHAEAIAFDGWTVTDGKYHPSQDGALYTASAFRLKKPLDLTQTKYISFNFYATAATFDVGLLDTAATNMWGQNSLFIHLPFSDGTIGVNNYVDCTVGNYYGGASINVMDGAYHNLKITILNGKVSYALDGAPIPFGNGAESFDAPNAATAYLVFRAVGVESYIDDLQISNEDIEYIPPVIDNSYDEVELTFDKTLDGTKYFTTHAQYEWSVQDGVFSPKEMPWAATYLTQPIAMDGEKYISFDFLAYKNNGDETQSQFNVALTNNLSSTAAAVAIHCFMDTSTPVLTVNSSTGKEDTIASVPFDWTDGNYHRLAILIKDKTVSFEVDGSPLTDGKTEDPITVTLTDEEAAKSAYLFLQATNVMSRIDNFSVKNTHTQYVAPTPEQPIEFTEITKDYSTDTQSGFTKVQDSGGDWAINADGKLSATANWAKAYLDTKIPLTEEKTLTVKFKLSTTLSGHQFTTGFATDKEHLYGLFAVFYQNELSFNYGTAPQIRVISKTANRWYDGEEHTLKFIVEKGQTAVLIDDEVLIKGVQTAMQSGYFLLQSSTTEDTVSAITVKNKAEPLSKPDPSGDIATPPVLPPQNGNATAAGKTQPKPLFVVMTAGFSGLTVVLAGVLLVLLFKKRKY